MTPRIWRLFWIRRERRRCKMRRPPKMLRVRRLHRRRASLRLGMKVHKY